jgi:hypothetical protein
MSFRFWSHVAIGSDDECWPWLAYRNWDGYGRFRIGEGNVLAHRHAFELTRSAVPDGLRVLHDCDNPCCCNPAHLHLGTIAENNAERNARGREARGERNGRARLTEADVRAIRARLAHGHSHTSVADAFGVHSKTIYQLAYGLTWRHVQ